MRASLTHASSPRLTSHRRYTDSKVLYATQCAAVAVAVMSHSLRRHTNLPCAASSARDPAALIGLMTALGRKQALTKHRRTLAASRTVTSTPMCALRTALTRESRCLENLVSTSFPRRRGRLSGMQDHAPTKARPESPRLAVYTRRHAVALSAAQWSSFVLRSLTSRRRRGSPGGTHPALAARTATETSLAHAGLEFAWMKWNRSALSAGSQRQLR